MIAGEEKNLRNYYLRRVLAYQKVFDKENQFLHTVLADLAKFCRAHKSTFHKDDRTHALLEGRREVFLRITEYLELNPEELIALHSIKDVKID